MIRLVYSAATFVRLSSGPLEFIHKTDGTISLIPISMGLSKKCLPSHTNMFIPSEFNQTPTGESCDLELRHGWLRKLQWVWCSGGHLAWSIDQQQKQGQFKWFMIYGLSCCFSWFISCALVDFVSWVFIWKSVSSSWEIIKNRVLTSPKTIPKFYALDYYQINQVQVCLFLKIFTPRSVLDVRLLGGNPSHGPWCGAKDYSKNWGDVWPNDLQIIWK